MQYQTSFPYRLIKALVATFKQAFPLYPISLLSLTWFVLHISRGERQREQPQVDAIQSEVAQLTTQITEMNKEQVNDGNKMQPVLRCWLREMESYVPQGSEKQNGHPFL